MTFDPVYTSTEHVFRGFLACRVAGYIRLV